MVVMQVSLEGNRPMISPDRSTVDAVLYLADVALGVSSLPGFPTAAPFQ
jgi:hypothetical protein